MFLKKSFMKVLFVKKLSTVAVIIHSAKVLCKKLTNQ